MRALVLVVGLLLFVSTASQSSTAAQVTLAWDASTDPNVTGYNLYYGGASQQYTNMLSAGLTNSIVVGNLTSGATYYFAATAMNSAGLESLFSTEVSCLVAGTNGCVIILGNLAQVYDGSPKAASVSTSPAGLAVALTYNGLTTAPVAAGNYQVIATVTSPGYSGSATNTLTISKAAATVQISGLNTTYNGSSQAVTAISTPAGLAMNITYNGSSSPPTNAGSYQVVAAIADPNYSGGATNMLVIAKATATVQLANLAQTYDGTPKAVSATSSPASSALTVTYNGTISPPVNAGSYQVIATISDANCSGGCTNVFVIARANATVQLTNCNQIYNGTAKVISASTTPGGLAVILTYGGSASAPTNAGSYQVVANVSNTNYDGTASATLVIAKAAGQVQLSNLSQTYDGTPKLVTATTLPAGLSVLITYNGQTTAPSKAGTYTVVGSISDLNYSGGATNKLTIAKPKGRTGATSITGTQALAIQSTTAAVQIVLSWPPTDKPITVLRSTDLQTWTTLTNVPGASGSITIRQQQLQPEFFKATWTESSSTNCVPIQPQEPQ